MKWTKTLPMAKKTSPKTCKTEVLGKLKPEIIEFEYGNYPSMYFPRPTCNGNVGIIILNQIIIKRKSIAKDKTRRIKSPMPGRCAL
jgi:hypothetical protein